MMLRGVNMTDNSSDNQFLDNELHDEVSSLKNEQNETTEKLKQPGFLQVALSILAIITVVLSLWGIGTLILSNLVKAETIDPELPLANLPTPHVNYATAESENDNASSGLIRTLEAQSLTATPAGKTIIKYIVETGDSIFSIAEKFGLMPETVLWSNRYTLGDTPDGLYPGVELLILPEDGLVHLWSAGEGLNGVSSFYGVKPQDIVNYPLNNLDPVVVGEFSNPNIAPGTLLVVPGGTRPTVSWVVARDNPAAGSSYLGPGACSGSLYGAVGTGFFTYPTVNHFLSGYDWNPPVHNGLDFDGDSGSPIFASDTGLVVYSGWSTRGYGNLLVVDHDKGWQTIYAHLLDGSFVPCGTNVYKGDIIGYMGSTGNSSGPHLHFEMRYNGEAVNPWDYLY